MVPPRWLTMLAIRVLRASTAVSSMPGSSTTINSYSRIGAVYLSMGMQPPWGQKGTAKYSNGPAEARRRRRGTRLLPAVALFLPGVAAHVVAVLLPEAWAIAGHELQATHPLGALPEVQVRDEQPQRPAVLRTDRLPVARIDEHVFLAQEVVERQVGGEAMLGLDHHMRSLRLALDELHQLRDGNA